MVYIHNSNNDKTNAKTKLPQDKSTLGDEIDLSRQSTLPSSKDISLCRNDPLLHEKDTLLHGIKLFLVTFGLGCSIFLTALDYSILSTALPKIASDFNGLDQFALVSFQPMYGNLSDIFGPKATFLISVAIFLFGSFLCGIASNMISLIIYRAVAGIGGAGITSLVIIIISEIVSIKDRGKFQVIIAACYSISSVVGPLAGGALTDYVSWRIDILGIIIMVSSTTCILLSLNWGGNIYAWDSPVIIILLCVGILGYIVFVLVENSVVVEPIAPPHLFKNLNVVSCFFVNLFMGMSITVYLFYIPLYFQVVKADSATQSGLDLMPHILAVTISILLSGQLFSRTDKVSFRLVIMLASLLIIVGAVLTTMWNENTSYIELKVGMIITGIGIGFTAQSIILCIQYLVENKDMASAIAFSYFSRNFGCVFGIAISGSAFNNRLSHALNPLILPSYFSTQSVYTIQMLPSDTRTLVIQAYVLAFQLIFGLAVLYSVLYLISAMFIGNSKPMHK
ncbi:22396_t:CDS:10 [Cetraspora pellucida]|uniref:22396_t:CDS:1 n=1 Tax=Cetraspora pellucida TaxID=1433469 RepID=A0A9N9A4W4_9GLOM|nr:22396_t:CDS:10 [Cetraspora pellucida]